MTKTELVLALQALSDSADHRSESARLQDIESEIDAALQAGVSRKAILAALHSQGFTMTLKSFESALYRLRRRRKSGKPSLLGPKGFSHVTSHLVGTPVDDLLRGQDPTTPRMGTQEMVSSGEGRSSSLDKRQRRELLADQFIQPDATNPLLKRLKQKRREGET